MRANTLGMIVALLIGLGVVLGCWLVMASGSHVDVISATVESKDAKLDGANRYFRITVRDKSDNVIEYNTDSVIWKTLVPGRTYNLKITDSQILEIISKEPLLDPSKKGN